MPELKIKFDCHGLGDVTHMCHALQLYKRRGYDITVQVEENKKFLWKVAGVNIVQVGDLRDHSYHYPVGFDDLLQPDHATNKVAFGLRHDVMPKLEDLGLTQEQAWDELCAVRLSARDHISPEAYAEADAFLEGLPRPIICFHSRGTNWHERKSLSTEVAFDVILKLLDQSSGSVVVLDFDQRAPMVGSNRCKGIKPSWGHIDTDRLCALYERCNLMIGIDSGPFHVAALTPIKALGVFRLLHPPRVCLPNPNAVYLVSDQHAGHWKTRRDKWDLATYHGSEPTADDIANGAIRRLSGGIILNSTEQVEAIQRCTGRYIYRRVGYDERIMELAADGTIGRGKDGCEQTWSAHVIDGCDVISLSGKDGLICSCRRSGDKLVGQWNKFEKMPIELVPAVANSLARGNASILPSPMTEMAQVAATYTYRRVGYDQRPMELLQDGTIGAGSARAERTWKIVQVNGQQGVELSGESGVIAICTKDCDDVWRGRWTQFERMPVELVPSERPVSAIRPVSHTSYPRNLFTYVRTSTLIEGAVSLARKLPPVRAVVGIPRSGVLVAAAIALELNIPLLDISALDHETAAVPHELRRRADVPADGLILLVDDTAASGQQMQSLRERFPYAKTATVFCDPRAKDVVDFWEWPHPQTYQAYEWNILHDDNNAFIVTDLDGVLCEDWTGGDEEKNPDAYAAFLANAKPRRVPTTSTWPLMAIVTGRLERHRAATEVWLARHRIRYSELIMSPHPSAYERDRAGDTACIKSAEYQRRPDARLFIESCGTQSRQIKAATGRPVLSIEDNQLV